MVALTVAIGLLAAEPIPQEIVVESGPLKRYIQLQPRLRTTRIENSRTGDVLRFAADSPEFIISTTDGRRFTTSDFVVESNQPGQIVLRNNSNKGLHVVVEHPPDVVKGTLARRLTLKGLGDLDRLVVEAMKIDVRTELGGLGRPLFLEGRWFIGLEHPVGINTYDLESGRIQLQQHPSGNASMKAVVGGVDSNDEPVEDAFERYIDSIRRTAPKPLLQYNTWYDLRAADLNPGNARRTAKAIHDKLLKPFDLHLHSFVLDDGWQERKSLWEPQGEWNQALPEFASFLLQQRAKLGLWMPLNGASLDVSWGEARGFPRTNYRKPCYCLASSRYQSTLVSRMRSLPAAFYKHDFNYLTCSADEHPHLATLEHGREANVEGQIAVLDANRIDSAVTSNAWPSPYWLKHTEFLWIGSYDYSEDWSVPCWSKRQAEMTFRDRQIHRLLRIDRTPVPMNALMTHGLIRGRLEGCDADGDLNDWSDYVMMFLGRGVMLQELYITPELLGDEEWRILGAALQWANQRAETLKHTRMVGGRPDAGEPYGYIHWSAEMGIACLRNPSPRPTQISLSTAERPCGLPSPSNWSAVQIYPDRRKLPDMTSNRPWAMTLNGHEVALVEFHRDESFRKIPEGRLRTSVAEDGVQRIVAVDVSKHSSPVLQNGPDRLDWDFELRVTPGERTDLMWWTQPDSGVVASLDADESVESPSDVSASQWSLHRRMIESEKGRAKFCLYLPWSPFWPQETKASAFVRTSRKLNEGLLVASPLSMKSLPEVRPSHRDSTIEETLVLDGWRFHRRRSLPEKIGWVLALGLAPIALAGGTGRKLGTKWGRPRLVGVAAAAVLVAIYTLTPLGGALGRVLGEF